MKLEAPSFPTVLIAILCLGLALIIADCSAGHWRYFHGTVTNHRYVPERVTLTTDSQGHTETHTSPEEFHLGFLSDDGTSIDISCDRWRFDSTQDKQTVWVKARQGIIGRYLSHIVDQPPTPEQ